jgi:hypothetical protein
MSVNGPSAAILCSGSSFLRFMAAPPVHDVYIGVNRTVEAYPCDWWVFTDSEAFVWYRPMNGLTPKLFTSGRMYDRIAEIGGPEAAARRDRYGRVLHAEINTACPSDKNWTGFSMLAAIVLTDWLNIRNVMIYGCDWMGQEDWDGTKPPGHYARTPYRWQNEVNWYGHVVQWIAGRGSVVRRFQEAA